MPRTLFTPVIAALSAAALVMTGCATSTDETEQDSDAVEIVRNCDRDVDIATPPERIYAAYQPAMEIAFALGAGDRLVGGGFPDSELLFEYSDPAQADDIEITDTLPSRDAFLATNPDFVLSGYNNVFTEEGDGSSFGPRAGLDELGVQSWILSPLCPSADGLSDEGIDPATVTVETIYNDLRTLGEFFGAPERAEEIITDQEQRLNAVAERVEGREAPTVALLLVDDDGSFRVAGGIDFGTRIIEAAGGKNAFADLTERRHVDIDIEELIRRDPDYILTNACCEPGMTAQDGMPETDQVRSNPALAGLTAVRNDRVMPFLFSNRAAGIRAAHATELLADILHPQGA